MLPSLMSTFKQTWKKAIEKKRPDIKCIVLKSHSVGGLMETEGNVNFWIQI